MRGLIAAAGTRLIKRLFRLAGLDVQKYAAPSHKHPAAIKFPTAAKKLKLVSNASHPLPSRPAPFVLVSTNHGTLIVNRNDYHAEGGYGMAFQLMNSSCYDYDEVALALTLLSERKEGHGTGVVALDCGANIGVHTVEWARHMHDWGTVIAVEAQERLYYSLCGNIVINNCLNARAIWAAVGSRSGTMRIPVPDYNKPASFGSLELRRRENTEFIGQEIDYSEGSGISVDLLSIDDLQLSRLDLLKIDVEGMEMDVLAGAEKTISTHRPMIIVEVIKSDEHEVKSFLARHGYRIHYFGGNILGIQDSDPINAGIAEMGQFLRVEL